VKKNPAMDLRVVRLGGWLVPVKRAVSLRRGARNEAMRWSRAFTGSTYEKLRAEAEPTLKELPELVQKGLFEQYLNELPLEANVTEHTDVMTKEDASVVLRAGMATFAVYVETRIASAIGQGFYTIGPCGEELMGVVGALARDTDPMALHYRHLAVQMARQLSGPVAKGEKSLEQVMLDRARAPVISIHDPVTGGHHCALGGGPSDFYVTSTLASQAPPAVGRALGLRLAPRLLGKDQARFPSNSVSIVSVGDGSVNNSMFMSAANLARYSKHRSYKCPVLFVISNNDVCISLRGYNYLDKFVDGLGMPVFRASGNGDMIGLWDATSKALNSVRSRSAPAVLVVNDLPRRFGHAATDRQIMYLSEEEIEAAANTDPLRAACDQALKNGLVTSQELLGWWKEMTALVNDSFITASQEPKITSRDEILVTTKAPLAPLAKPWSTYPGKLTARERKRMETKPQPMRVLMNQVFAELLASESQCVYIGEDVRHGGYYRVTDDLADAYPERVQDVPPDETSVIGLAMGYSQCGLVPIAEIPYAKYLDCGADMFNEAILTHWCTSGGQRDGMVVRLQGFDKGVFGGNFHTHNMISLPPGLDVVCYSNGRDYVRGMRHAFYQAKHAGRITMSVDSTDLLYKRDVLKANDSEWLHTFPFDDAPDGEPFLDFETVIAYPRPSEPAHNFYVRGRDIDIDAAQLAEFKEPDTIVLSYGNGVLTSLRAASMVQDQTIMVVDCPTLGVASAGLKEILARYPGASLVFADVCKSGQHPFGAVVHEMQEQDLLQGRNWRSVAAVPTYNPLGCTLTFLNEDDILGAIAKVRS